MIISRLRRTVHMDNEYVDEGRHLIITLKQGDDLRGGCSGGHSNNYESKYLGHKTRKTAKLKD